jgi:hypothetical protein
VLVAVTVLTALGTLCIWAHSEADPRVAGDIRKQLLFVAVGFACMLLVQAINYRSIGRWAWGFYIFSLLLLIYTVAPVTHVPNGDQRLLRIGMRVDPWRRPVDVETGGRLARGRHGQRCKGKAENEAPSPSEERAVHFETPSHSL